MDPSILNSETFVELDYKLCNDYLILVKTPPFGNDPQPKIWRLTKENPNGTGYKVPRIHAYLVQINSELAESTIRGRPWEQADDGQFHFQWRRPKPKMSHATQRDDPLPIVTTSSSNAADSRAVERMAAERAVAERVAAERAATERVEAKHAAAEKAVAEHIAAVRVAAERAAAERETTGRVLTTNGPTETAVEPNHENPPSPVLASKTAPLQRERFQNVSQANFAMSNNGTPQAANADILNSIPTPRQQTLNMAQAPTAPQNFEASVVQTDFLRLLTGLASQAAAFLPLQTAGIAPWLATAGPGAAQQLLSPARNLSAQTFTNPMINITNERSTNNINVNDMMNYGENLAPQATVADENVQQIGNLYAKLINLRATSTRYTTLIASKNPPLVVIPPAIAVPYTSLFSTSFEVKSNNILLGASNELSKLVLIELNGIHSSIEAEYKTLLNQCRPNNIQLNAALEIAKTKIKSVNAINDRPPLDIDFYVRPDIERKQTMMVANPLLRNLHATGQRLPASNNSSNNNFNNFNNGTSFNRTPTNNNGAPQRSYHPYSRSSNNDYRPFNNNNKYRMYNNNYENRMYNSNSEYRMYNNNSENRMYNNNNNERRMYNTNNNQRPNQANRRSNNFDDQGSNNRRHNNPNLSPSANGPREPLDFQMNEQFEL